MLLATAAAMLLAFATAGLLHRLYHPPRRTYGAALARHLPGDPADLGLAAEERMYRFADGTTSPGWRIVGGDARGPAVVLTHGWSESRFDSLDRARLFAPDAAVLVVYDLRGHGEATSRTSALGTTEIADLLAVIEQSDLDGGSVVLAGWSMGGGVSIAAAAASEPGHHVAGVIVEGGYRLGLEPIVSYLRLIRWPVTPIAWLVGAHLAFWTQSQRAFDRVNHAKNLRCPLLMLHGDADAICPIDSARRIAAAAPGGRLVEFPGGEHLDLARRDPERYLGAVRAFLLASASAQAGSPRTPPQKVTA